MSYEKFEKFYDDEEFKSIIERFKEMEERGSAGRYEVFQLITDMFDYSERSRKECIEKIEHYEKCLKRLEEMRALTADFFKELFLDVEQS